MGVTTVVGELHEIGLVRKEVVTDDGVVASVECGEVRVRCRKEDAMVLARQFTEAQAAGREVQIYLRLEAGLPGPHGFTTDPTGDPVKEWGLEDEASRARPHLKG